MNFVLTIFKSLGTTISNIEDALLKFPGIKL